MSTVIRNVNFYLSSVAISIVFFSVRVTPYIFSPVPECQHDLSSDVY